MPKYYSLMLSENISKTVHGYLICENALLCRSGYQEYKGSELVGFPGYEEDWNLEPETRYNIYRPKESVLDPEFIKSIEGNTVVDEHPDGSVVHIDNDKELNCGHIERVGKGPDIDGEATLKGDIFIKDPDLIEKVRPENNPDDPNAVRDISLGYSLRLKRLEDGTIIMTHLRGNHVAVVEKGRAGPLIAIKDSALPEEPKPKITIKENTMSLIDKIFGLGLKQFATDASPEDIMAASKELGKPAEGTAEKKEEGSSAEMSALKAYMEKGGDKAALMAFLSGSAAHDATDFGDKDESLEELEDETLNHKKKEKMSTGPSEDAEDDEDHQSEASDEVSTDSEEIDDGGQSVLKQANDSMRALIKANKPMIALIVNKPKSKRTSFEQTMVDNYNGAVKAINKAGGRAYAPLVTKREIPEVLADSDKSITKADDTNCGCFDGVPYRVGLQKHREHTAQKGNK